MQASAALVVLSVSGICSGIAPAVVKASPVDLRPRVAVVNFRPVTVGQSITVPPAVGRMVAELVVEQLVARGTFRVIDPDWLEITGAADAMPLPILRDGAARSGVRYLVVGSIQQFGIENKKSGIGLGIIVPALAGVGRKRSIAHVSLVARLVDTETGEVVASATAIGQSHRRSLVIGGAVFGRDAAGAGAFTSSSSEFRDSVLGEATTQAASALAEALVKRTP